MKQAMIARLATGIAAALALAAPASAEAWRQCPADFELARLVAKSDVIAIGMLGPETMAIVKAVAAPAYVRIPIRTPMALKGTLPGGTLSMRFFTEDRSYAVPSAALIAAVGTPRILFLTGADNGALYLSDATALRAWSRDGEAPIRREIARQRDVLATWHTDQSLPHFTEVRALIARLGGGDAQDQRDIFAALERLGAPAVPAIVALMDDRRALADPAISLSNAGPDAFEATRHYGPELVVDALAAILNQLTGQSFGEISNGGSEAARQAAVAGWRVYAADLACPGAR